MNSLQLFTAAFSKPQTLAEGKKMAFWKVVLYVVFLSMILSIPVVVQVIRSFNDVKQDSQEIATKIPDFEINDGKLTTAHTGEGFIYQTNSIIFTFDPDGQRTEHDIQNDVIGNAVAIAFLQNEFYIALPDNGLLSVALGNSHFSLAYSTGQFDGLSGQKIREALNQTSLPFWSYLLIFVVTLYPVFINLIINLLLISIGAIVYSKLRLLRLRFFDCLKIVVYAATVPAILSVILQVLLPNFDASLFMILLTLFYFYRAVRDEPRMELPPM